MTQKIIQAVCKGFGLSEQEIFGKIEKGNINAQNAKGVVIYFLREYQNLSFGQIAKEIKNASRGNVYKEYITTKQYYEANIYQMTQKIDSIRNQLTGLTMAQENPEYEQEREFLEKENAPDTPETIGVEDSPLSQPVIERDISSILRPEPKKVSETDFLNDFDDYERFESQQDEEQPDTIPEVNFEPKPNENPNEVTFKMDEETADFSTESILNMLEFGSVELACYYANINEREVRELEREGEVPPKSAEISKEANDNSRKKLEENANKKIKLLSEPLKKVIKRRNVSVSPESALVLALMMFGFSMFMTARSIKKDNEFFLEKLRKLNTEIKAEKEDGKENF